MSLVGVEVEVEGIINHVQACNLWEEVEDGSLRDGGSEFRFREPLSGEDIVTAVNDLELSIVASKNNPSLSYRTSVHVHVDVRSMNVVERLKFVLLYIIFEKALFRLHGNRKNNYYCVPFYKSDSELSSIASYVKYLRGEIGELELKGCIALCEKYSAMNLKTSTSIGSFEFRHMEGTYNSAKILRWISILLCMKEYALKRDVKWDNLPGIMSAYSPMIFLEEVFKEHSKVLTYPDISKDMYEGVRTVDFICHMYD